LDGESKNDRPDHAKRHLQVSVDDFCGRQTYNSKRLFVCALQNPTSADDVTLPAFAAERRASAPSLLSTGTWSDRYLLPAGRSTVNPPLLLSIDETDRRTDRQTLDRFIDPATHTCGQRQ